MKHLYKTNDTELKSLIGIVYNIKLIIKRYSLISCLFKIPKSLHTDKN